MPVWDVNISNTESVKSSTFPLRGWVEGWSCYFRYLFFSKPGRGEYFLTSCVNNFSGKWGRGGVKRLRISSGVFSKTFSNIYKGNFHRNVTEFQGEVFVDIAKPTAFDVIHKRS